MTTESALDELALTLPKHNRAHEVMEVDLDCRICELRRRIDAGEISREMANALVERDEMRSMALYDRMFDAGAIEHMSTLSHKGIREQEQGFVCITCGQQFPSV